MLRGLIVDADFENEINVYRKESTEAQAQASGALFSPNIEETSISSQLTELDQLKTLLREEAEKLKECIRQVNITTSQYLTELDYEAEAIKEEADAKIRAQEEFVNPKIAKLTKDYRTKIKDLTESFEQEIESLQKLKTKTQKNIEANEEKIRLYLREVKAHTEKNHAFYEKHWNEKIKHTKKEQNELKKELKNNENNIKKLSKQKVQETSNLNFSLDAEIKFARQPLLEIEVTRDAKILTLKQETDKLLKQEKPVIESLNKAIKLRDATNASFERLGIQSQGLKNPGLFQVPFYAACFEIGSTRRFHIIPPSTITELDFSVKIRGAFGMPKIKDLLTPRFKTITTLIDKVQVLTKQNAMFENQLNNLAQRNNLLNNGLFMENVARGLVYLRHEGWLSDKEQQVLSNQLTR